jgi:hypothetical protein
MDFYPVSALAVLYAVWGTPAEPSTRSSADDNLVARLTHLLLVGVIHQLVEHGQAPIRPLGYLDSDAPPRKGPD